MPSSQEKLARLRQRTAPKTETLERRGQYESKKKSLLERLQKAPVIAALALLATYSPVKADGLSGQNNVFTTLDNSPLRESYEYVQENYQDQTPGARLAHLFNLRLEKNNVGNLNVGDEAINQAAIEQAQTVLDFLRGRGVSNPTWRDIQNIQGDYNLAQRLAGIEARLGATGTAAYTRVVFGNAPEFEKEAISELTYRQHTELRNPGWKPFKRAEDVADLDFAQLQNTFPGQDTPEPTPAPTPDASREFPEVTPLTEEEINRAVDAWTSNTPTPAEDTLPINPADILLTPAEINRATGEAVDSTPATPSPELRGTGVLNFEDQTGNVVDPLNSTVQTKDIKTTEAVEKTEPDPEATTPPWITKPWDATKTRFENLRRSTRRAWPLALTSLVGAGAYAAAKRKKRSRTQPFPTTPTQASNQTGSAIAAFRQRTQTMRNNHAQLRRQIARNRRPRRGLGRFFGWFGN